MNLIADTNVLLRTVVVDDEHQSGLARATLSQAEQVIISIHVLCELAWVLRSLYDVRRPEIARAIRLVCSAENTVVDWTKVEAGLAVLDAGGDFADGVIEFEGRSLGGETFVSFDQKATALLEKQGRKVLLLK